MSNLDNKRTSQYKKNATHENVLKSMNEALLPVEKQLVQNFSMPKHPIIFIVGAQRSGTTLLMQLIAQLFDVSYPTNFIARYWNAPYIGATLYKNLSSQLEHKELDLQSDLGYTKGLQGPHEFGYFWKRWFPWESWETPQYEKIDYSLLQKELSAWQSVNDNPLVFKNILDVSFNIKKMYGILPQVFFIHIKRKPEFVVQSTYLSRQKLFNDISVWMGLNPPEFKELLKLNNVFEQIAAQVYYSVKYIEKDLENVPHLTISYEDLVNNTENILRNIELKTGINRIINKIPKLENTNKTKLPKEDFEEIKEFCKKYFNL